MVNSILFIPPGEKQFSYIYVLNTSLKWPVAARPCRYLTTYFSESTKDRDVKFWHNLDSSRKIIQLQFRMDIIDILFWKQCEYRHRSNFGNFFNMFFDWKENFNFRWFHRRDLGSDLSDSTLFQFRRIFFVYIKINF